MGTEFLIAQNSRVSTYNQQHARGLNNRRPRKRRSRYRWEGRQDRRMSTCWFNPRFKADRNHRGETDDTGISGIFPSTRLSADRIFARLE